MHKDKELMKCKKEVGDVRVLIKVPLVSTIAQIYDTAQGANLTVRLLHQQLDTFPLCGVPDVKANSTYTRKPDKQAALESAPKIFQLSLELYHIPEAILAKVLHAGIQPVTQALKEWHTEEDVEMEE
ncbi:hypothetical protein DFH08DRAFT_823135 [Mycena albidolilacea]|uniref:Uncharacterized protein n=1 Tax=Mycena albidolilacea TaxID=1033008 RepID=A0AAD7EBK1_9AGAR|nr:hypothetical protein DFH08DRAFT_823135 [Mycena albidolilacea]